MNLENNEIENLELKLKEVQHSNREIELEQAVDIWGSVPELLITVGDETAKINANANLEIWKDYDGYIETQGICKLESGEFIHIEFLAGSFMTYLVTPTDAVKIIMSCGKYELLDAFKLQEHAVELICSKNCCCCKVAE